jgi:hypothetical protein
LSDDDKLINGHQIAKEPETEEEFYELLAEIRNHLIRTVTKLFMSVPHESISILALDQPGVIAAMRKTRVVRPGRRAKSGRDRGHGEQIVLNVPDGTVENLSSRDPLERDLVVLIHIPASTATKLYNLGEQLIQLPN